MPSTAQFEVALASEASSAYRVRRFGLVEPRLSVDVRHAFQHTCKVATVGGRTFMQVLLRPVHRKQPLLVVDYTFTVVPEAATPCFVLHHDANEAFRGAVVTARHQLTFGFEVEHRQPLPAGVESVEALLVVQYRTRAKVSLWGCAFVLGVVVVVHPPPCCCRCRRRRRQAWVRRHSRRLSLTGVVAPESSSDVDDFERALPALRTLHEHQVRMQLPAEV